MENIEKEKISPLDGLSKPWQKFFKRFDEIDEIKVSQWKDVHALGHICRRYEKIFGKRFAVTIKGAPTKSPDMYMIKRIKAMLNTTDMSLVKEYIDWVYDEIIIPKKTRFRKVGFFITPGFVNDFLFKRKKKKEDITRSTYVSDTFKNIAKELNISISTYGDLAFIKMAIDSGTAGEEHKVLLGNLEILGLDLNKLKDLP